MSAKKRLDVLVYERGFAESREKAKVVIMSGIIYVDNQKSDKPGTAYSEDVKIEMRGNKLKYVSRGGLKLEKAIDVFKIDLKDKTTMDIGASTGGFTDCMLQNGAKKVYSIDVGHGQLDWKLRNDERVVNLERTNVRYVTREQVPDDIDFFSVDVCFISLIKPQFEAGRKHVGKNGVVRDKNVHKDVIRKIYEFCLSNGFDVIDLDYSPIKGPEGNIEYLLYIRKSDEPVAVSEIDIDAVVEASHLELDK